MIIYFYSPQKYIAKKLAEPLECENHICHTYTSVNAFVQAVENLKEMPDLLVLDYTAFNHNVFNVYRYMTEFDKLVPLIFYNDPIPKTKEERISQWEIIFSSYYTNQKSLDIKNYKKIFEHIASIIESKELKPYIPLLQEPLPPPKESKENFTSDPLLQKIKEALSASLYILFCVLYKNKNNYVSLKTLSKTLNDEGHNLKTASIYSGISRLREKLAFFTELNAEIIRSKNGYKLFIM